MSTPPRIGTRDRYFRLKAKQHHRPIYTLEEIAGKLGIEFTELRACMAYAVRNGMTLAPKPEIPRTKTGATRKDYYDLKPMIEWYTEHKQLRSKT